MSHTEAFYTIFKNKKELIGSLIKSGDVVLDVGFWGQGVRVEDPRWPHKLLREQASDVYGLDLEYDESLVPGYRADHYFKQSAEDFSMDERFDAIFAGDLIEHLSNPGLFLDSCKRNLKEGGRLIITTPNCYGLFDLFSKIAHFEPVINRDHTCYFNIRTLKQLLGKNGWELQETGFLYSLGCTYQESMKKRLINVLYRVLSWWTPKFIETVVVVAVPKRSIS